ncbi:tannase/feruloyl esterase family alpha/beta hydrolase [Shewanella avicenniae]|uniref:Tannase/feruloyl esterase family alpha/beta hydrolase n=1 Tax=Shewanella avicenniae TaxID=2814294 RepID=A0ABX7QS91_9GAMM|nr:tannase/feruloyl esterase family alpha/beta hydrolase [Shewanella avicenniae]QSX33865.1 tannase/feruloyl esterase family alpha/beta hydrolase [Shewanella avicenniae]
MKHKHLLLPFVVTPLCLAMWGCNDSDNDKTVEQKTLPVLTAAQPASIKSCEDLAEQFKFNETYITGATTVAAGEVSAGFNAPAHCLITGYMNPRKGRGVDDKGNIIEDADYQIGFEMRLPVDWNGRFYYQANGGMDGSVVPATGNFMTPNGSDATALHKGFAVISSDAGHSAAHGAAFGLDPQARRDYGYNAVAELTPMAKSLIEAAYGKAPDRSYFGGCSNGGRHTMVAATRYADLYDGFLVGDPGFHLPQAAVSQVLGIQKFLTLLDNVDESNVEGSLATAINRQELGAVSKAVLQQCDALDGAADGMVNAIEACQVAFDLQRDVPTCSGERDGTCLTTAQKDVLADFMAGPHNSAGEALYTNMQYDAGLGTNNVMAWFYGAAFHLSVPSVSSVFTTPPTWLNGTTAELYDYVTHFSADTDAATIYAEDGDYTEASMTFMPPVDPSDMGTLRDRGAKLIAVHGTSDPVFYAQDTINWYNDLQKANTNEAGEFARLYLVPGMNHCGYGPATDKFDALDKLVTWVEEGKAPEEIVASARENNAELPADWSTTRTRPLCPYPEIATYNGTGSIEDAASFSCKAAE